MKRAGDIRSQNELADIAGISKSALSEALSDSAVQTTVMPEIHRALGWPKPLLAPPVYVLTLVDLFLRMPELDRGRWLERMRQEVAKRRPADSSATRRAP